MLFHSKASYFFIPHVCAIDYFCLVLQVFLDHRPRDEVRQLVSARTNGATPLVLSCRNGHKDVVEYLVERCNADVEQAGTHLKFVHLLWIIKTTSLCDDSLARVFGFSAKPITIVN